jgi:hypothetical protein
MYRRTELGTSLAEAYAPNSYTDSGHANPRITHRAQPAHGQQHPTPSFREVAPAAR